jgi:hypothetical protein
MFENIIMMAQNDLKLANKKKKEYTEKIIDLFD